MKVALEKLDALKGTRHTEARRTVLDAIVVAGPHVDMETICREVRRLDSGIGQATVYRTVGLLVAAGLLVERSFGQGRTLYEWDDSIVGRHHDHIVCLHCGCVVEFVDDSVEEMQATIATRLGFSLEKHSMVLYGICPCCRSGKGSGESQCPHLSGI